MSAWTLSLFTPLTLLCASWGAIGPFGGSAAIVQVDGRHPGTVLAATANALLFRSLDSGESWNPLPFPPELRATLHALVVDPWNDGVYFAGVSSGSSAYCGIWKTSDGGFTWSQLPDFRSMPVWAIAVYPKDSSVMAAGTEEGVFLSRDHGTTWERITPDHSQDIRPIVSLTFDPADSNVLYAGTPHLAWKTRDSGASWDSIHKGMLDDSDVFSILVDDRQRRRLFAATCGGLYRSLDGAAQWSPLSQPKGVSSRTYFVTQHPRIPNVLFAGTANGLLRSMDSGTSWQQVSAESTRSVAFDPVDSDRIFIATDDAGLFRSDDLGQSITSINRGFCNRNFSSLVGLGNTLVLMAQTSNDGAVLAYHAGDKVWQILSTLDSSSFGSLAASESGMLYLVSQHELAASPDSALTWAALPPTHELSLRDVLFASSNGETLFAGAGDDVYGSYDAGETWQGIESLLGIQVYGIVSTVSNGLLAASSRGLLKSDDAGKSWRLVTGNLARGTVKAICKHPTRPRLLFASQYGMIFRSRDDGRLWTPLLPANQSAQTIQSLAVSAVDPNSLFVLIQNRGVYRIDIMDR